MVGRTIADRYRIEALIARGGAGVVYRAVQVSLGRIVAVKVLDPVGAVTLDEAFHDRFMQEASVLSRLSHPNTVRVYDYGSWAGLHYLVMEFVDGVTLADLVRIGPLAAVRAMRLAEQVARALYEAHSLGVMHRDLKPSNILVCGAGEAERAKIIDFGLVKAIDTDLHLTRAGMVVGTPMFIAPEILLGEVADHRVDVYSFGVVLFFLLAGELPFQQGVNARETLARVLVQEPRRLIALCPNRGIPAALDELVAACLSKEPQDRPEDMRAVARSLRVIRLAAAMGVDEGDVSDVMTAPLLPANTGQVRHSITLELPRAASARGFAAAMAFVVGFLVVLLVVLAALRVAGVV